MTKGSAREYRIIQRTRHYLWKRQNSWLSNRRSVCQLPMLFTAENYPAAKVISKGNPKASSAHQRGCWEQFLAGQICRQYINEEASHTHPGTTKPGPRECSIFWTVNVGRDWIDTSMRTLDPEEPAHGRNRIITCPRDHSYTPHPVFACPTIQHYPEF